MRIAVSLHRFSEEFQRRRLVPLFCDVRFQNLPFVVDNAPKLVRLPADLHEDLVEVPAPLLDPAHSL